MNAAKADQNLGAHTQSSRVLATTKEPAFLASSTMKSEGNKTSKLRLQQSTLRNNWTTKKKQLVKKEPQSTSSKVLLQSPSMKLAGKSTFGSPPASTVKDVRKCIGKDAERMAESAAVGKKGLLHVKTTSSAH